MKFIDEALITVQSGNGGRGCVSFRREKFVPKGGPDGGDGGDGGDVVLKSTTQRRTLYQFRYTKHFKAQNGQPGEGSQRSGKSGENLTLELPPGTIVYNADTEDILHDFTRPDETYVIAKGGMGGRGNQHFKSSTNRAPRYAQTGTSGETLTLRLELKLLADVGIIGFPNAGKSTLVSVISSARPKIGDYPFTTLTPNLGVVQPSWGEPFAVADIPGLIEGAHAGTGLGDKFLRHIERTHFLVHLIDASAIDPEFPLQPYRIINRELSLYSTRLAEKKQVLVLNKLDLPDAEVAAEYFMDAAAKTPEMQDVEILFISAATGKGVDELKNRLTTLVNEIYS